MTRTTLHSTDRKKIGLALFVAALLMGIALPVHAVTEITLWHDWGGQGGEVIARIVETFEAQNPDIIVHVDIVPDMNDKLLVALMGGVAPDVVLLDRWLTSSFAAQGALVALDPYIARDGVNPDDYFPATWEEATYRGTSYGIPFNTDTRALLYHASMFAEAGLDPDRPPSTWDDLWEITPRLTRRTASGELLQVGYVPHHGHGGFVHYLWQNGGSVLNEDHTEVTFHGVEGEEALQFMFDFVEWYGGMAALDAFNQTIVAQGPLPALLAGRQAIIYEGNWHLGSFRENFPEFYANDLRVALPPMNKNRATLSGGFALALPSSTRGEQLEAAWRLIRYLTSEEPQLTLGVEMGVIPANRHAAVHPDFMDDEIKRVFIESVQYAQFRTNHPAYPRIEGVLQGPMQSAVLNREMSIRAALEDAARQTQLMLDEVNEVLASF